MLLLLFLKHLSERFEVRKQELQLSFFDPQSDYRTLSFDMKLGDSLLQDRFPDLNTNLALMNPPIMI